MLLGGKRIYICVIVYLVYGTAKLPQKDELEWFYIGIRSGRGRRVSSPTLFRGSAMGEVVCRLL